MKMRRFTVMIVCFCILVLLLTSCSGYNSFMRKHLSDETNYTSFRGEICDIYYLDAENNKVSILSSETFPECDVVLELVFEDYETVKTFLGGEPNRDYALNSFKFIFRITKENSQMLMENGFYDTVAINTPIDIRASSFIYMDSDFFFIAAVKYDETEYLHFEDGIRNIKNYINNQKSLL